MQTFQYSAHGFIVVLFSAFVVVRSDALAYEVPKCGLLFIVIRGSAVMRVFPILEIVQQEQKIRNVTVFVIAQVLEVVRLVVHQVQKLGPRIQES